jgi:hypothetical protein
LSTLSAYNAFMRLRFVQHLIIVIALGALLGASVAQWVWPVQTGASPGMTTMTQAGDNAPMPCKGMTPACMTDLGCIFIIGLPTVSPTPAMTLLSWQRIRYDNLAQSADGLTRKPALHPPSSSVDSTQRV